jgi:conjugal transfer pilus assembly protein TraA
MGRITQILAYRPKISLIQCLFRKGGLVERAPSEGILVCSERKTSPQTLNSKPLTDKDPSMTALVLGARRNASLLPYLAPALVAAAMLGPAAAFAGTDTSFNTALSQFTNFLSGSGGKVITVLSLAGGIVGLASGRFSLGQVAVPVGTGVAAGTGAPIVTAMVTALI